MSSKDKEHLNLVVIGHVDHGKSTMTGRLLYETGAVDERTFQAHKAEAEKLGRPSWIAQRFPLARGSLGVRARQAQRGTGKRPYNRYRLLQILD